MSIPQNAKDLRRALDRAQLFTLHIPGSKGALHQVRVANPVKSPEMIIILVESSRYTVLGDDADEIRLTTIAETVETVRKALRSE